MRNNFSFLLCTIIFFSCHNNNSNGQKGIKYSISATKISLKLAAHTHFLLNYISPVPPTDLSFNNESDKDSIITDSIGITNVTEFFYLDPSFGPKGVPVLNFKYLLVFPGDSICIDEKRKSILFSSNNTDYIEHIIDIPGFANLLINPRNKNINPYYKGLNFLLDTTDKIYQMNCQKISRTKLNNRASNALNTINLLEKYYQIYLMSDIEKFNSNELKIMDSINNVVLKKDSSIFSINSPNIYAIIGSMIKISAKKNGANIDNYWSYFTNVDKNLKQFHFYKYYAFYLINASFFYNFNGKSAADGVLSLQQIYSTLLSNKDKSELKDSLIKFTNILLETKTNYAKAKQELNNFYNGKYAYVFANDAMANHEKKTIANMSNVKLFDFKGNQQDFRKVIMDKKYKVIIVDFWASWCVPCLKEMPFYLKAKEKLKNKSIKFVGISIDNKNDENKWITIAQKGGLYNDPYQYRLEGYVNSPLTTLLQINTIPRYIVFDNNGNVIDDDIERPSSGDFEEKISKYIQ